jgi:hypothetical protein
VRGVDAAISLALGISSTSTTSVALRCRSNSITGSTTSISKSEIDAVAKAPATNPCRGASPSRRRPRVSSPPAGYNAQAVAEATAHIERLLAS